MDPSQSEGKRLWHIVRVVYYMLRKGVSKHKLMLDLHLLLKRGRIAGKALGNLITFHGHHHQRHHTHHHSSNINTMYLALSCRSMDPNLAFYSPKEVQFSCSNTPSYPSFSAGKRKNRRASCLLDYYYDEDVMAIAKTFELLNSEMPDVESTVAASPSPAPFWMYGKSPAKGVRQLRITDSPFPIMEEGEADGGHIDKEAGEFISWFREQLRLQEKIPETPESSWYYQREPLKGRA